MPTVAIQFAHRSRKKMSMTETASTSVIFECMKNVLLEAIFACSSKIDRIEYEFERMRESHDFSSFLAIYMIPRISFVEVLIIFLERGGRFIEIRVRPLFRTSEIAMTRQNFERLRNIHYTQVKVIGLVLQFLERKMRKKYVNDVNAERDLLRRSKKISIGNDRREM